MEDIGKIERGTKNHIYSLIELASTSEIRELCPHLYCRFSKLPRALELSVESDGRLLEVLRRTLPPDLSPTLVAGAERYVLEAGNSLRENLFVLFSDEIIAAIKKDRNKEMLSHGHR